MLPRNSLDAATGAAKVTTQPSKDHLTVLSYMRHPIDFFIDCDGDMRIEDDTGEKVFYVRRDQLPALRDWLNEVLSR